MLHGVIPKNVVLTEEEYYRLIVEMDFIRDKKEYEIILRILDHYVYFTVGSNDRVKFL